MAWSKKNVSSQCLTLQPVSCLSGFPSFIPFDRKEAVPDVHCTKLVCVTCGRPCGW